MFFSNTVFFLLIFIKTMLIIFISFRFYRKKDINITTIGKKSMFLSSTKKLSYFWDPKAIIKEMVNDWIPNIGDYTIAINSDSLNKRFDNSINKPQTTFRIIILGDSFAYGLYTNTYLNWTEKLEDKLNNLCNKRGQFNKVEIINLVDMVMT